MALTGLKLEGEAFEMNKSAEAFRTIGEVADELDVPKHVLRFWEGKFPQIRPMKRGGGRRYYRPEDMELLRGIRHLLHAEGYTIKGVQKILREQGIDQVKTIVRLALEAAGAKGRGKRRSLKEGSQLAPIAASAPVAAAMPIQSPGSDTGVAPHKASPAKGDIRDVVKAAIRELEVCRVILGAGKSNPKAAVEPRRARAANR
jgi:DNA-binding transcriptional MerR regulator